MWLLLFSERQCSSPELICMSTLKQEHKRIMVWGWMSKECNCPASLVTLRWATLRLAQWGLTNAIINSVLGNLIEVVVASFWEKSAGKGPSFFHHSHFIIFFFTFILDINLLFQELNAKHLPTEVPVWRFIKLTSSVEVIFILGNPLSKKFTCVFKHILRIIRKIWHEIRPSAACCDGLKNSLSFLVDNVHA